MNKLTDVNHNIFCLLLLTVTMLFGPSLAAEYWCKDLTLSVVITDLDSSKRTFVKNVPDFKTKGFFDGTRSRRCIEKGKEITFGPYDIGSVYGMNELGLTETEKVYACRLPQMELSDPLPSNSYANPNVRNTIMGEGKVRKVSNKKKWFQKSYAHGVYISGCDTVLSAYQAKLDAAAAAAAAATAAAAAAAAAAEEEANRCNFCLYTQKQIYVGCVAKNSKFERQTSVAVCKARTSKEVMDELGSAPGTSVLPSTVNPNSGNPSKQIKRKK